MPCEVPDVLLQVAAKGTARKDAPVVVRQLVPIIVDPKHVQHIAGRVGGYVRLEDRHVRLPQRVHQVCVMLGKVERLVWLCFPKGSSAIIGCTPPSVWMQLQRCRLRYSKRRVMGCETGVPRMGLHQQQCRVAVLMDRRLHAVRTMMLVALIALATCNGATSEWRTVQDADAVVGGHLQQEGVLEVGGRGGPAPRRHIARTGTGLRQAIVQTLGISCVERFTSSAQSGLSFQT